MAESARQRLPRAMRDDWERLEGPRLLVPEFADAAVEHQATLMSDDPVPVTLAEACDRLSTTARAHRDLQQPGARRRPAQHQEGRGCAR